jgi:hypothetical protein
MILKVIIFNLESKDFKDYQTNLLKAAGDKCHTLHRFECTASSKYNDVVTNERRIKEFHLYYNSPKCAEKVLGAGFIAFSFLILAIFALIF